MSLFDRMLARCPICDTAQEIDLVGSVNAGRRPDLREQILARRFQEQSCVNCGALFRLPPGFTYVDYDRGQWILAHPADQVAGWQRLEAEARAAFDSLYGPGSGAEEVGRTLRPRITFGWLGSALVMLASELKVFDAVVFDPPRQGAEAQTSELAKSKVTVVIAVSCDATTFARDARVLVDGGYTLAGVTPVDQFRYSHHVELVAKFTR